VWTEGVVDTGGEHIELSWGALDKPQLVARLAPAGSGSFSVQFVVDKKRNADAVAAVIRELNFYLLEVGGPNPWAYAKYHCGTASNIYSSVHWALRNR
jgi:hypothetical protein